MNETAIAENLDGYHGCLICKFFYEFDEDIDLEEVYGICRRFPPVQKNENAAWRDNHSSEPLAHSSREWSQPVVEARDWCSEFSQSNAIQAVGLEYVNAGIATSDMQKISDHT